MSGVAGSAGVGETERSWLKVWSGTWNVFSAGPPADLSGWLGLTEESDLCDIYAFGFQEANASPVAWTSELVAFDPWTVAVSDVLCKHGLARLFVRRVLGLLICLFVKIDLLPFITNVEFSRIRTSMTGKGALAVRFRLNDLHMVFVNCHFCPHTENISVRNREYFKSISQLRFNDPDCRGLLEHNYVIWMGDFNYRLDTVSVDTVRRALTQNRIEELRKYDQLTREKDFGYVYNDFNEGLLSFRPSYKFIPKTHEYDFSNPRRLPSWCDRIQWRVMSADMTPTPTRKNPRPSSGSTGSTTQSEDTPRRDSRTRASTSSTAGGIRPSLQLLSYTSHGVYTNSDHKPVSGQWMMAVPSLTTRLHSVTFVTPQGLTSDQSATIQYEVQESVATSNWDWIALCKIGWQWEKDYVTYVWAPKTPDNTSRRVTRSVSIEQRYVANERGMYQLVYYSAETNNSVLGISRPFWIASSQGASSHSIDVDSFPAMDGQVPVRLPIDADITSTTATAAASELVVAGSKVIGEPVMSPRPDVEAGDDVIASGDLVASGLEVNGDGATSVELSVPGSEVASDDATSVDLVVPGSEVAGADATFVDLVVPGSEVDADSASQTSGEAVAVTEEEVRETHACDEPGDGNT